MLPEVISPVLIEWDPVTRSHPRIGKDGPVKISRYQFFVEQGATKLSVDLPPTVTEFEIPRSITDTGGVFKFEIIARTIDGKQHGDRELFPDAVVDSALSGRDARRHVRVRTRVAGLR